MRNRLRNGGDLCRMYESLAGQNLEAPHTGFRIWLYTGSLQTISSQLVDWLLGMLGLPESSYHLVTRLKLYKPTCLLALCSGITPEIKCLKGPEAILLLQNETSEKKTLVVNASSIE
jgi:hypothetical protein